MVQFRTVSPVSLFIGFVGVICGGAAEWYEFLKPYFSLVWNFEKQNLRIKYKIEEALYSEMFQNFIDNKKV